MSTKDQARAALNIAKAIQTDASEILGDQMKTVLKIEHEGFEDQPCYVNNMRGLEDILESMLLDEGYWGDYAPGNLITISVVEIPVPQFEALEEFEGFI